MSFFNFFSKSKVNIKKEIFDNDISSENSQITYEVINIVHSFYVQLLKTEQDKILKNNPDWKFERVILLGYLLNKINTEVSMASFNDELFDLLNLKTLQWMELIYEKEYNMKDGFEEKWEISREELYNEHYKFEEDFSKNIFNENFTDLITYIFYFGFKKLEISATDIYRKKLNFDDWMFSNGKVMVDINTLFIPGFSKIKEYLSEF